MQSPRAEWTLAIGHLAVLDYLRSRGDADSDTLSEVVREAISRHPSGRAIFAAGYAVGSVVLYRHLTKP